MKRSTGWVLRSCILVVVFACAVWVWVQWREAGLASAPGNSYQTAIVSRGSLERTVSSSGTLAAVETVVVGTEVSGTVQEVLVDFNDQVTKGQVLTTLKPDLFAAAVADAQGSVDQATANLELAQQELERNQPLFEKGYLSAQEFSPYRSNRNKAAAALASAQAGLSRARTNRANAVIRSPIAGTVIERAIDAGQTVAASLNTPTLFVIARDLGKMQIEVAVDETDIGQIRSGQQARFSVQSYPDKIFTGVVRQLRLQPTTVQNVVTYTVIVAAENNEKFLLPGMTATVDFIVERVEDALLVPNAALRFRPAVDVAATDRRLVDKKQKAGSRLFTLTSDGRLQRQSVSVGSSDGQMSVVTGGELQEGARVVTGITPDVSKPKAGFSLFGAMRGRPSR